MSYQLGKNVRYQHPLKDEIYKKGYTIEAFANECEISKDTLYNIFKGSTRNISWFVLNAISDKLGMPYDETKELCKTNK